MYTAIPIMYSDFHIYLRAAPLQLRRCRRVIMQHEAADKLIQSVLSGEQRRAGVQDHQNVRLTPDPSKTGESQALMQVELSRVR
jgi:hypothetical protein